jgi:anaerobic dimethyl sulfoxide reductase subunit B (iron-sulfur subunit)
MTCIVACKDWHDVPAGPASWRHVETLEKGTYPDLFVVWLSTSCYHCSRPVCLAACKAGAISKREEDGIVLIDNKKCLGKDLCTACLKACPYKAPQFGTEPQAKMQKCDFCLERLVEGKKPICVESCPMSALDCGDLDLLNQRYGSIREAEGFKYAHRLDPSIIYKPRQDTKNRALFSRETAPMVIADL